MTSTIDQYYTEDFLSDNKAHIKGELLKIKDEISLKQLAEVASNKYDCIVLPQILNSCEDYAKIIDECARILKPRGRLLCTLLTISTPAYDNLWGFTAASAKYIFEKKFKPENIQIKSYGNALTGRYFLERKKAENLSQDQLNYADPYFPLIIGISAVKAKL